MIIYIEGIEVLPPDSTEEPEFIRIRLDGVTEDEAVAVIDELMAGLHYIVYRHYCRHDEDPRKSCSIELIKEVRP